MRQYGKTKIKCKVPGHGHGCSICVPDTDKKIGRARARRKGKKECLGGV